MSDRLTRWEGQDEDGARAVLVKRDGAFHATLQEALRKLARYEDKEGIRRMSILHLLWIVPLAASAGGLAVGVVVAAAEADDQREAKK